MKNTYLALQLQEGSSLRMLVLGCCGGRSPFFALLLLCVCAVLVCLSKPDSFFLAESSKGQSLACACICRLVQVRGSGLFTDCPAWSEQG